MYSLKTVFLRFALILFLLVVLLSPIPARADVAPPAQPTGANLLPESEATRVQMVAERVLLDITKHAPTGSLGQARITADFTMRNVGEASETMAVRFPLSINDGFFNYPEITDLEVSVSGQSVATRRIEIPGEFDDPIAWAEFDVTFPPGRDLFIQVAYTQKGTGEYPFVSFGYILETGAGWHSTIGEGNIIVRLPYQANDYNVIFNEQIGWSQTSLGAILAGNEVRWHFENLEPTSQDNFQVSLVMPSVWQKALVEQVNVVNNPQDGVAWGRLGKIYKEIIWLRKWLRSDVGGQELYHLSREAYEQAVTLLPDDALWHAGYAELLWYKILDLNGAIYRQEGVEELLRALELLDRSLALSPGNSLAVALATDFSYFAPEAVQLDGDTLVFLYLTATPAVQPTVTASELPTVTLEPSVTPLPTDTSLPTHTPLPTNTLSSTTFPISATPTATTAPPRPVSICGVVLLIFLPFIRRKSKR